MSEKKKREEGAGGLESKAMQSPAQPKLSKAPTPLRLLIRIAVISLVIVGATTMSAVLYAESRPSQHAAQADVLVDLSDVVTFAHVQRRLATLELIGVSFSVTKPVAERTGVPLGEVEEGLSVQVVADSDVMRIRALNADADTAVAVASTATEQFVELLTKGMPAPLTRDSLEAEIARLETTLAEIDARISELGEGTAGQQRAVPTLEQERLLAEMEATLARLSSMEDRLFEVEMAERSQVNATRIIEGATLIGEVDAVPRLHAIAIGGFVGLVLASGAAVLLWQMATRRNAGGEVRTSQPTDTREERVDDTPVFVSSDVAGR